jgi:hypothetical protein
MIPPAAARAWRASHGFLDEPDGDGLLPWVGPGGLGGPAPDGGVAWWKVGGLSAVVFFGGGAF